MENLNSLKVLILYNRIYHYRIPIFNLLAEKCDLTVAYSLGTFENDDSCRFKAIYLPVTTICKRIVIQKKNIIKLAKNYNVVVAYGDIAWLKYSTLPWFSNVKVLFWTIGVSASYTKRFDQDKRWDKIRSFFYKHADGVIFYTEYPIQKYVEMGLDRNKMFIAPNTVKVNILAEKHEKTSLLFIGTLYRQKGIQCLLNIYNELHHYVDLPVLNIIGDGPEYMYIKQWITERNLASKINLLGAIYSIEEKSAYFSKALACISPSQAGLAVLESMGYGVPFITTKNAYTGGEVLNITNGENGVVLNNISELKDVVIDVSNNRAKYIRMGENARSYYNKCRTPFHMAMGLYDAIKSILNGE